MATLNKGPLVQQFWSYERGKGQFEEVYETSSDFISVNVSIDILNRIRKLLL